MRTSIPAHFLASGGVSFAFAAACQVGAFLASDLTARAETAVCPNLEQVYAANGPGLELKLRAGDDTLHILAIGSSSTEGVGATSATRAYPARLAARLQASGEIAADVKNAGVGGETAETTLRRLKAALATRWPRLVIWQVGTNDALSGVPAERLSALVEDGVAATRAAGDQILLVDPQLAPRAANAPRLRPYAEVVDSVGAHAHAPVIRRYGPMQRLAELGSLAPLLSGDGLHMSDFGYDCLAGALATVIVDAAKAAGKGPGRR